MKLLLTAIIVSLSVFLMWMAYVTFMPKKGLIINKRDTAGYSFKSGNVSGVIYGRKTLTVIYPFDIKEISVDRGSYEHAKVGTFYHAPFELWMYQ
jgi:hypothetical protein